ncbi:MAG: hypothetical protein RPT95_13605 [Candidatus Sedimenticola sp. (ex Thyasira tokunagai)]
MKEPCTVCGDIFDHEDLDFANRCEDCSPDLGTFLISDVDDEPECDECGEPLYDNGICPSCDGVEDC